MKIGTKVKLGIIVTAFGIILSGCTTNSMKGMDHSKMNMGTNTPSPASSTQQTTKISTIRETEFTLTAAVSNQEIAPGKVVPVWTYNNSVPGPDIRVKEGDTVSITLKNALPDPVTIHWHGVPVPNAMDGIPGMTQNAVQPGKSFTYKFKANIPGTYWYHSHQDGVNQVDKGLYGSFIVEAKDAPKVDKDYTLVLDEWSSSGTPTTNMGNKDMSNMDHSKMNMSTTATAKPQSTAEASHDMNAMYDIFTINGKSGSLVDKLAVKKDDKVRLRLINAGFMSHNIHLHGHEFKITATDGQPVNNPGILKDTVIPIAPGERYDVEFVANNPGIWYLEDHGSGNPVAGMKAQIQYENAAETKDQPNATVKLNSVDISRYGQPAKSVFSLDQKYNVEYTMNLNTETKNNNTVYTINGKTFPETEPVKVKKGNTVKVRLVNNSKSDDHPMHLHGHFFQILSKNGQPVQGASLMKDTLNLKPGEEYVVAFEADNEGNWMFHCHDLHHASAGMMTELLYTDYKTDYVADPKAGNKPE